MPRLYDVLLRAVNMGFTGNPTFGPGVFRGRLRFSKKKYSQVRTRPKRRIWGLSGGVAGSFKLKLKTDLKNKFETGKPHLEKPSVICHHLVVFIQHDPSELRGL